MGLKDEDIDLQKGNFRVRPQISRINEKIAKASLKTKNAYRTLMLEEDTVSIFLKQKENVCISPCVFLLPNRGPIFPDSVLHILHQVLKRAGPPRVRFRNLRYPYVKQTTKDIIVKTLMHKLVCFLI